MEVSESDAVKQGRLHVWVGVCYYTLHIEVFIISPPPSSKPSYGFTPMGVYAYSTVYKIQLFEGTVCISKYKAISSSSDSSIERMGESGNE